MKPYSLLKHIFFKKEAIYEAFECFFFQKMTDEAVIYTEKEQKTIKQN